jgi:hypothetical protein
MTDSLSRPSRRRFLSGLAAAGAAPAWVWLDALAGSQAEPRFSGDDPELAHRLLSKLADVLGALAAEAHPERYDVIIVGGGIAGLASAYKLRKRQVLLLEREPQAGGVSKSETWQGIEYAIGAAYIIDPDPESENPREKENFQLLEELGLRKRKSAARPRLDICHARRMAGISQAPRRAGPPASAATAPQRAAGRGSRSGPPPSGR